MHTIVLELRTNEFIIKVLHIIFAVKNILFDVFIRFEWLFVCTAYIMFDYTVGRVNFLSRIQSMKCFTIVQ